MTDRQRLEALYTLKCPTERLDGEVSDRLLALRVIRAFGTNPATYVTPNGEMLAKRSDAFVVGFAVGHEDEVKSARDRYIERQRDACTVQR